MRKMVAVGLLGSLILAACASAGSDPERKLPMELLPTVAPGNEPAPDLPQSEPGDTSSQDLNVTDLPDASLGPAEFAVADLAVRLDVEPATIAVVLVEEVSWRDGSHGCPEPGMSYTQAVTSGTRVGLRVAGIDYWYHGGDDGQVRFCADPRPPLSENPDA